MYIEVKAINDILIMKINENCSFDEILNELDMLLDKPIFMNDRYYPRAYFDFGCRFLSEKELYDLFVTLYKKKCILFTGISLPIEKRTMNIISHTLHSGEEIYVHEATLFISPIHYGSYVYIEDDAFFLNVVQGHIIAQNPYVRIYGRQFYEASIMINGSFLHHLTTSALTSVYYKDGRIVLKEDDYGQNHCYYIR